MSTKRLILLVIVALMIGIGCNRPATDGPAPAPTVSASPAADAVASTRTIYSENCVKCHGEKGEGGRVQIENREIKVPNLTGEHARKPSDERIAAKISEGDDEMPAFKDKLTAQQIQDLVRFIRTEFQAR